MDQSRVALFVAFNPVETAVPSGQNIHFNLHHGDKRLTFLIVGALLFSILMGMIAGAIPAYRASKLNPVDALRYE